jgi:hypothetical protein
MGSLRKLKMNDQEVQSLREKTLMTTGMIESTQHVLANIADVIDALTEAVKSDIYDTQTQLNQLCKMSAAYSVVLATFNDNKYVPSAVDVVNSVADDPDEVD